MNSTPPNIRSICLPPISVPPETEKSAGLNRPLKGQDGKLDHPNRGREEGPVMKVTTIGIDLAKDVFGMHGVDGQGRVAFKKRLVRNRLLEFMSQLPPCLVGLEACSSAHYWARKIERLGHRVRLMSPRFVKPYRKSDKNDANDAEAICEAVTRPSMRFVPIRAKHSTRFRRCTEYVSSCSRAALH